MYCKAFLFQRPVSPPKIVNCMNACCHHRYKLRPKADEDEVASILHCNSVQILITSRSARKAFLKQRAGGFGRGGGGSWIDGFGGESNKSRVLEEVPLFPARVLLTKPGFSANRAEEGSGVRSDILSSVPASRVNRWIP